MLWAKKEYGTKPESLQVAHLEMKFELTENQLKKNEEDKGKNDAGN